MPKVEGLVLAKVNFPLYTIQTVTSHHVLVGGGGGSAKTGVANGFELFELSHDGKAFYAEERIRHETGDNVVMNCDVHSSGRNIYVVAGQENSNQLYKITTELTSVRNGTKVQEMEQNDKEDNSNIRKRKDTNKKGTKDKPTQNGIHEKRVNFTFKNLDTVQTVFSGVESLQRVVKLSRNGKFMVTGGTDGQLRLWSFPKMKQLLHIEAHSKEIDDVDFNISNDWVVSIAKDGKGFIWNCKNGSLLKELKWITPENIKYLFKRCRFGLVEDNNSKNRLFTLSNPLAQSKKGVSYIQQWDVDKGEVTLSRGLNESLSSLAVRDDGRYIAVGTMFTGSVYVYISFSLQQILHVPHAHSMFVTGLEFVPALPKAFSSDISSINDAAVLSISVDNKVCMHTVPHRCTISTKVALLLVVIVCIVTFLLMTVLGL